MTLVEEFIAALNKDLTTEEQQAIAAYSRSTVGGDAYAVLARTYKAWLVLRTHSAIALKP